MAQARDRARRPGVQSPAAAPQPGYELLDKPSSAPPQFQQQVTYQRALEGEIARTIAGVEGVIERRRCSS